jgi:hypothetical protein
VPKYAVIEYGEWMGKDEPRRPSGPTLCQLQYKDAEQTEIIVRWPSGGYMHLPEDVRLVEGFEAKDWEAAELYYYRKYTQLKAGVVASEGWLSPEGLFYPCGYGGHDSLATRITAVRYGTLNGTKALGRLGWLRLHFRHGAVAPVETKPTTAQMTALWELSTADGATEEFTHGLRQTVEINRN